MAEKREFKKSRRLSRVRGSYRKWEEWEKGDIFIGKFVSEGKDQYKKPSWAFETLQADFADGSGKKLIGKILSLNSAGFLDKSLKDEDEETQIEPGQLVQVEYTGKEKMTKGPFKGKMAHTGVVDLLEDDEAEETLEGEEDADEEDMDL